MMKRILALIEVSVVFSLMIVLFRIVHGFPLSIEINASLNGYLFSEYTALLIIGLILYTFRFRNRLDIPLKEKLNYQAKIIGRGFFPIFLLSVLLSWVPWGEWGGSILISAIQVGLLVWFAWLVKDQKPTWQRQSMSSGLLLFPILMQISEKVGSILIAIVYFYLFVAVSEEILFRGYIQTRLNSVFGSSRQFFSIPWGWGVIFPAIFFGFWHLGLGTNSLNWPHVIWTTFAGLIFGIARQKSGSVIAPSFLHGIMNYGPQAILFYLFWQQ